jgi:hypothetical protein
LGDVDGPAVAVHQGPIGKGSEDFRAGLVGNLVPPAGLDDAGRDGVHPAWGQLGGERSHRGFERPVHCRQAYGARQGGLRRSGRHQRHRPVPGKGGKCKRHGVEVGDGLIGECPEEVGFDQLLDRTCAAAPGDRDHQVGDRAGRGEELAKRSDIRRRPRPPGLGR